MNPKARTVRKKPCPYCEKLLEAPKKRTFHNHLARHLRNCQPFQVHHAAQMLDIVKSLVALFQPDWESQPEMVARMEHVQHLTTPDGTRQAEVAELERLHSLP